MKRISKEVGTRLWIPAALVLLWEVWAQFSTNIFFPAPTTIAGVFRESSIEDFIQGALLPTLQLLGVGYLLGSLGGIILGTISGSVDSLRRVVYPIAVFLRALPTGAKLPVILGILGIGSQSLYLAVILSVFFNLFVVTTIGIARVHHRTLEQARVLQLNWFRTTFLVKLPAALGDILTGLQLALQVSILVTVLVEALASGNGMGAYLLDSQYLFRMSEMWIAILTLGFLGLVLNEAFNAVERTLAPWYFAQRRTE